MPRNPADRPATEPPDTDLQRLSDHLRVEHGVTAGCTAAGLHGHHDGLHGRTWAYQHLPEHHWRWAEAAQGAAPHGRSSDPTEADDE